MDATIEISRKNSHGGRNNDGQLQIDVQNLSQHQRRGVQQDSRAEQQVHAVEHCRQTAHRLGAETDFEKLIGAVDSGRAKPWDKHEAHHHDAEERSYLEHKESHVVAIDIGGSAQEGGGADGCGDKAYAYGNPGHGPATEHVFLEVLVAPGNPEADKQGN
jgi:hypothetical protein